MAKIFYIKELCPLIFPMPLLENIIEERNLDAKMTTMYLKSYKTIRTLSMQITKNKHHPSIKITTQIIIM